MGWSNKGNVNGGKDWLMYFVRIQLCLMHSDDNDIPRGKADFIVGYEKKF
jgi:hypothetical protein